MSVDIEKESFSLCELSEYAIFKNIKGTVELNNNNPSKINILSGNCFSIGWWIYSGGIAKEVFYYFKKKCFCFEESFFFFLRLLKKIY